MRGSWFDLVVAIRHHAMMDHSLPATMLTSDARREKIKQEAPVLDNVDERCRTLGRERGMRDEPPSNRRVPMRRAPLRDHPGAPDGLCLPLHGLPAHHQQRVLDGGCSPG